MRYIKHLFILAAVTFGGCETLSPTTQEDVDVSLNNQISDIPDSWQATQARIGEVQVGWIDQFDDPVLSSLVAEAIQNNRDLQVGAANVERAYAMARQAGVPLKPSVEASGSLSRKTFFDGPDTSTLKWGTSASWEVDIWKRLRSAEKSAYVSAQAAETDYIYSQHSIAAAG